MGFDCDVPEKVLEALVSNHWGARSDAQPALPEPNMIVQWGLVVVIGSTTILSKKAK